LSQKERDAEASLSQAYRPESALRLFPSVRLAAFFIGIDRFTRRLLGRFLIAVRLLLGLGGFERLLLRLRLLRVRGRFRGTGHYAEFRATLVALARLRWQIRFYASLKRLLRGWRVFHASLAVFLVLVIAAHIGVSLYLGYGLLHR
jgi:hypothetical protein